MVFEVDTQVYYMEFVSRMEFNAICLVNTMNFSLFFLVVSSFSGLHNGYLALKASWAAFYFILSS